MDRLLEIKRRAPDVRLYAAGGLRGAFDLMRLEQEGMSGVLVASALHDGRLTGADLAAPPRERCDKRKIKGAKAPLFFAFARDQFGAKGCFATLRCATT